MKLYEQIKSNCKDTKMTRSRKSHLSIFGMFVPDTIVNQCTGDYLGKLTNREKNIDFKYYFDDQGRIILTERYPDKNNVLGELIFYFYNGYNVEFALYGLSKNEIGIVGLYEYGEDRKLSKYLEGRIPYKECDFRSFYEISLSYKADSVEMKISSCGVTFPDKVFLRSRTVNKPLN